VSDLGNMLYPSQTTCVCIHYGASPTAPVENVFNSKLIFHTEYRKYRNNEHNNCCTKINYIISLDEVERNLCCKKSESFGNIDELVKNFSTTAVQ